MYALLTKTSETHIAATYQLRAQWYLANWHSRVCRGIPRLVGARGVHGLDFGFFGPGPGCVRQNPDSGFLKKNRIRTGFGFCNLLVKNGLWDWAVPVIRLLITYNLQWLLQFCKSSRVFHAMTEKHTTQLQCWVICAQVIFLAAWYVSVMTD